MKQRRFVEELPLDWNATQAAIRAGYAKNSARQEGSRLLSNADIQDAIAALQAEASKRCQVTQDDIIAKLVRRPRRGC
jgi:phage terminase small subunit